MYYFSMPMFPGEREFTPEDVDGDLLDVTNAFAYVSEQTGLIYRGPESFDGTPQSGRMPNLAHFSVVPSEFAGVTARGAPFTGYIVCRPYRLIRGTLSIPDADRWWVFDSDLDEYDNAWVPQAVFTPDGFISRSTGDDDDDDDVIGALHGGHLPTSTPRDPHAPVRMNIDLEEHEDAAAEGIPTWEEHENWAVLSNHNGIAVVWSFAHLLSGTAVGMVRYPDKTACTIKEGPPAQVREMAEKFLANRPYKTAMQRVLDDGAFADEDAPSPPAFAPTEAPTRREVPRPQVEKRVWRTVPIESAEEDD